MLLRGLNEGLLLCSFAGNKGLLEGRRTEEGHVGKMYIGGGSMLRQEILML